jgi:hypothetical protein
VLVATTRSQGRRDNDFISCPPGELVDITSSCDRDRGDPDGGCGCCRAFTGLDSRLATTTAEVVERAMSFADYVAAHHASLLLAGVPDGALVRGWAEEAARDMARIAAAFVVGDVVERRGDQILQREDVTAPAPAR